MKNKLPATLPPIKNISKMKSQFRNHLRLAFFLLMAAFLLPITESAAQCSVSNILDGFQMNTYTSSGQSFVPTCSSTLLSVSFDSPSNISKPDQVDIILGEPGNSGGTLYSIGNPQWSGNTHTLTMPVPLNSGQTYTVLFIRQSTSDPCLHRFNNGNPIPSGKAWAYTGTYYSGNWSAPSGNWDLVCNFNIASCTPPAFTACPSNLTVNADPSNCNATASYNATTSGTPAPALTYSFLGATTGSGSGTGSGSTFNRGVTTVVLTATNSCGSTNCIFTVTVNDVTEPTITCPANITVGNTTGQCAATVTFPNATATDNCTASPTITPIVGPASGSFFDLGSTSVTFRATDGAGNSSTCAFTVTVRDMQSPTITCPANVDISANTNCAGIIGSYSAVSVADNCTSNPAVARFPSAGTVLNGHGATQTVRLTATDAAGNTQSCTFTVTLNDVTPPTITCPANITVNNATNQCGASVTFANATATDNCAASPTISRITGPSSGSFFAVGSTSVTFRATDGAGNSSTCAFTVTVNDTQPPGFTFCPVNQVLSTNSMCQTVVPPYSSGVAAIDNCAGAVLTQFPLPGTTISGTTTIVLTATDAANNQATCSFDILLMDNTFPSITCPANVDIPVTPNCTGSIGMYTPVSVSDNCTANPTVAQSPSVGALLIGHGTTQTVRLTATDNASLGQSCTFTVTLKDVTPPTITCKNATVNLDAAGSASITTADVFQSGTDNCGTVNQISVLPNTFTCSNLGDNTVTLLVNDGHGNTNTCAATVTVVDNIAPTVVCKDATVNLDINGTGSITTADVFQSGADNCGTVNQVSVLPNTFTCSNLGANPVTLLVNDGHGNTNTCTATVTVVDNINPTVICKNVTVNLDINGTGAITTNDVFQSGADNCGVVNQVSVLPNAFTCSNLGTNPVTLLVNDGHGNTSTCTATVTVADNINPTVICKNVTINLDASGNASITTVDVFQSGADNCGTVNQVSVLPNTFTCSNLGANIVTLLVNDGHGNTNTCMATVTVADNINPTVICKNATINLDASGNASISTADVFQSGADNCGVVNQVSVLPNTFNCSNLGTNPVTLLVNDGHGNTNTCMATVTVVDNINPTVICKDATVNLDVNGAGSITTTDVFQSGTDNCGIVNQVSVLPNTFTCSNLGANTVTLLVNDGHGNTNTCTATVTVADNVAPTVICKNVTINLDINGTGSITTTDVFQSGTDNCGIVNQVSVLPHTFTCSNLGANIVTLLVNDGHGNTNTCTATVTVVDNINPTVICKNATINLDASGNASITTVDVFQSGADNCGTVNQVSVLPNTFTCSNLGTKPVTLLVNDGHGNTNTCTATVTVVDNINPTVICKNATVNLDVNGTGAITTNDVFQSGADNCGTVNQVSVLPSTFNCSNLGANTVTLLVNDGHGNTNICKATVTVVDNINPTVICKNATVNLDINGTGAITTNDVFQSGADNCGTVNQVSVLPNTFSCSNLGANTVTLLVNDGHGNTNTCTATVTVVDNINPTVICKDATVNLDANGAGSITTTDVFQSGADNCGIVNQVSVLPNAFTCSNLGDNTVTLLVNDGHGNTNTCAATVTVVDNIAPTVVCKNVTINLDINGTGSITTADVFQSGADNCGTVNQVSVLPSTFNCSNLGANTVTLLVNDGHGNTNICTATVTVVDNINPTVICKDATVNLDINGAGSIITNDVFQSGIENCGTVNQVSVLPNTFTCNDLGTNIVTLTVNDGHGNTSTCTATVTVVDNEAPTVTCKDATVYINNGAASITIADVFQSAIDNCGTVNQVSVLPNTFTCSNVGTNNVTLKVNDGHGNASNCIATVTVADSVPPTIICKGATFILGTNGTVSISTADIIQSGTDNCGTVNPVSIYPNTFTCSNLGANQGTLTINDGHGNTSYCYLTIIINDDNSVCTLLPVELVTFKAIADKDAIQLLWETASERNNAGFQIERSENGREFEKIAFVAGAGTSAEKHTYQLEDKDIRAGQTYFYRLRQIDFDGNSQYSNIVQATLSGGKLTLLVSPNPAMTNSIIQLQIHLPQASEVVIALFDAQGRVVRSERHDLEADLQTLPIFTNDLPASTYFLKVTANGESVYQQLSITQ